MDTQALLQEAIAAVKAGNKARGRTLLARVLQADPRNEQAWLWMSKVVETDEQWADCLRQVLAINPSNEFAREGLRLLAEESTQQSPRQPAREPKAQQTRRTKRERTNRTPLIIFIAALAALVVCGVVGGLLRELSQSDRLRSSRPSPTTSYGGLTNRERDAIKAVQNYRPLAILGMDSTSTTIDCLTLIIAILNTQEQVDLKSAYWAAEDLGDGTYYVRFHFKSNGIPQYAEWFYNSSTSRVTGSNQLGRLVIECGEY